MDGEREPGEKSRLEGNHRLGFKNVTRTFLQTVECVADHPHEAEADLRSDPSLK